MLVVQLTDSFVVMTKGEAFLLGAQVTPLDTVSTHYVVEKARSRKLLLQKKELAKINQALTQKGSNLRMHRALLEGSFGKSENRYCSG